MSKRVAKFVNLLNPTYIVSDVQESASVRIESPDGEQRPLVLDKEALFPMPDDSLQFLTQQRVDVYVSLPPNRS